MRALEKRQRISWVHHQIWGRSLHWEAGDSRCRDGRKIAGPPCGGYLIEPGTHTEAVGTCDTCFVPRQYRCYRSNLPAW